MRIYRISEERIRRVDGSPVRRLNADGTTERICKLKLANCITVIE